MRNKTVFALLFFYCLCAAQSGTNNGFQNPSIINAESFGMCGDCSIDIAPKVSDFYASGKNKISFGEKTYTVSSFNISSRQSIYGNGLDGICFSGNNTTLTFRANASDITYFKFDASRNIKFSGFTFDGNSAAFQTAGPPYAALPNGTGYGAFFFDGCENVTFENCRFINGLTTFLHFENCKNVTVENCQFDGNGIGTTIDGLDGYDSIFWAASGVSGKSKKLTVTNCIFKDTGIKAPNPPFGNNHNAIHLTADQTVKLDSISGVFISNCRFERNDQRDIKAQAFNNLNVTACFFDNSRSPYPDYRGNSVSMPIVRNSKTAFFLSNSFRLASSCISADAGISLTDTVLSSVVFASNICDSCQNVVFTGGNALWKNLQITENICTGTVGRFAVLRAVYAFIFGNKINYVYLNPSDPYILSANNATSRQIIVKDNFFETTVTDAGCINGALTAFSEISGNDWIAPIEDQSNFVQPATYGTTSKTTVFDNRGNNASIIIGTDYQTAAPTWTAKAVGQITMNRTPAIGQPKGWVWTGSAWVPIGNL